MEPEEERGREQILSRTDEERSNGMQTIDAEGVMKRLVVDRRMQILDEDVPRSTFTTARISMCPSNAACLATNQAVIESVESTFSISRIVVIDICIS